MGATSAMAAAVAPETPNAAASSGVLAGRMPVASSSRKGSAKTATVVAAADQQGPRMERDVMPSWCAGAAARSTLAYELGTDCCSKNFPSTQTSCARRPSNCTPKPFASVQRTTPLTAIGLER